MPAITKTAEKGYFALALARISLGVIFLWAFIDKFFGLGFATCRDAATNVVNVSCSQAWLNGGSPTSGFLDHATKGPLGNIYQQLAGQTWVDWLFMAALAGIGIGLILGIGIRLATASGILLMLLMWSSALWPANNPFLDEHIVYVFVLAAISFTNSQQKWGLRNWWTKTNLVKTVPVLE